MSIDIQNQNCIALREAKTSLKDPSSCPCITKLTSTESNPSDNTEKGKEHRLLKWKGKAMRSGGTRTEGNKANFSKIEIESILTSLLVSLPLPLPGLC